MVKAPATTWNPLGAHALRLGEGARPLWYWMTERQAIWERRESGQPKPWTADRILQQFRFCNVFRELDKVTVWIARNIRERFAEHDHLWFMLAVARTINHPPTLAALMESHGAWPAHPHFKPEFMAQVLQCRKDSGAQVYTGAYMIRAESNTRAPWYNWTKQDYIARIVLGRLWEDRRTLARKIETAETLQEAWTLLAKEQRYIGWGPFMTYEWVTDLRWTRYLNNAKDIMTWANAGPGALRGLKRLRHPEGRLLDWDPPWTVSTPIEEMRELLALAPANLPPGFGALELRDIEHSLCEVDKYLRVYHNEGKPRANYAGT